MSKKRAETTHHSIRLSPDEREVLSSIAADPVKALHLAIALLGFRRTYQAPEHPAVTHPAEALRTLVNELKEGETK